MACAACQLVSARPMQVHDQTGAILTGASEGRVIEEEEEEEEAEGACGWTRVGRTATAQNTS